MVRYLSVCSGIEAATVAWHDLGWSPVAFSEIEAFPGAVLRERYPDTPNWGDMTKFQEWPDACLCVSDRQHEWSSATGSSHAGNWGDGGPMLHAIEGPSSRGGNYSRRGAICDRCGNAAIDLLVGGTPCQSFSVAGLRKGLADPRGNLALTYLAIADKYRPRWVVWENVPGVLSSAGGRDFGAFLGGLGQLGYGWAYRVLDAQYFGVAQRRRRVFVVGCLGGWQRAAAVLFERHSLSGHPAPRREAGQTAAPTIAGCANGGGANGPGRDVDSVESLIPQIANPLPAQPYTLAIRGRADSYDLEFRQDGLANALLTPNGGRAGIGVGAVAHAFDARQSNVVQYGNLTGPLDTNGQSVGLLIGGIDYENNEHTADEPTGPLLKGSPTGGGRPLPAVAIRTANTGANGHGVALNVAHTLDRAQGQAVAFEPGSIARHAGPAGESHLAPTLRKEMGDNQPAVRVGMSVRRLTPRECERLQGFPDDYTLITYRGRPAADGPRYKALGNSMAVPVMRWIGQRIQEVDRVER